MVYISSAGCGELTRVWLSAKLTSFLHEGEGKGDTREVGQGRVGAAKEGEHRRKEDGAEARAQ